MKLALVILMIHVAVALKGIHPKIIREYTYVYGAICSFDGDTSYLILPAMDSSCINIFLQEISERFPEYFLLVVYDGAPYHSQRVLNLPKHMEVVSLPPYSPELNSCENGWDDMREKLFKIMVFYSLQTVENKIVLSCNFYKYNRFCCINRKLRQESPTPSF
jgi:hypothetical protein